MRRLFGLLFSTTLAFCLAAAAVAADKQKVREGKEAKKTHKVKMLDDEFEPTEITIEVGHTITWTNDGCNTHAAKSDKDVDKENAFDTKDLTSGQSSKVIEFKKAGKVRYFCPHHGGMKGTITVKEKTKK